MQVLPPLEGTSFAWRTCPHRCISTLISQCIDCLTHIGTEGACLRKDNHAKSTPVFVLKPLNGERTNHWSILSTVMLDACSRLQLQLLLVLLLFSLFLRGKLGFLLLFPFAFVFLTCVAHLYSSLVFLYPTRR